MTQIKKSKYGIECVDWENNVGGYCYAKWIRMGKEHVRIPVWIFFWHLYDIEVFFSLN